MDGLPLPTMHPSAEQRPALSARRADLNVGLAAVPPLPSRARAPERKLGPMAAPVRRPGGPLLSGELASLRVMHG